MRRAGKVFCTNQLANRYQNGMAEPSIAQEPPAAFLTPGKVGNGPSYQPNTKEIPDELPTGEVLQV